MTRRNQKRVSKHKPNYKDNDQKLNKMLDIRKLTYFRYDAKELFNSSELDPKVWEPVLASLVTKSSRQGIMEAKEYLMKLEEEEVLPEDMVRSLNRLLDKYKKWR
jgi:hypothetical protein